MDHLDYLKRVLTARVYDVADRTPLEPAQGLSRRLGNTLKREDLQPVFSFKLRGAYNKLKHLGEEGDHAASSPASAGNHAQGVSMGAAKLGCEATIVMPRTTPAIKVDAVRGWGAKAVLHGDSFDEAYAHAVELVEAAGLTFSTPSTTRT
jgi:threonine dehydratase